jgi:biopolymer transport protein ExbD
MKFPRNAKILRSPFEMAPFVAPFFFLLVIFMMLGALPIRPEGCMCNQPPAADDLPGTDKPTVAVAVDSGGRFYFANQIVSEAELTSDLTNAAAKNSREPLTLVIHADKVRDLRPACPPDAARARRRNPKRAARHAAARRKQRPFQP